VKPSEPFAVDEALWRSTALPSGRSGRGWSVFVDGLEVLTRVGIHAHEHEAPQPVVIDARLGYRCMPAETGEHEWINYEQYCERLTRFLETKPHTRLLETLAVELAVLSFEEWGALDMLTLVLYKPKIRPGTQRIGIELDWGRGDYEGYRRACEASYRHEPSKYAR
jgi:dihydroneopterin aldolase